MEDPGTTPVSRAEAKLHCRVDDAVTEDDALIDRAIAAATAYLDGLDGVGADCLTSINQSQALQTVMASGVPNYLTTDGS